MPAPRIGRKAAHAAAGQRPAQWPSNRNESIGRSDFRLGIPKQTRAFGQILGGTGLCQQRVACNCAGGLVHRAGKLVEKPGGAAIARGCVYEPKIGRPVLTHADGDDPDCLEVGG